MGPPFSHDPCVYIRALAFVFPAFWVTMWISSLRYKLYVYRTQSSICLLVRMRAMKRIRQLQMTGRERDRGGKVTFPAEFKAFVKTIKSEHNYNTPSSKHSAHTLFDIIAEQTKHFFKDNNKLIGDTWKEQTR